MFNAEDAKKLVKEAKKNDLNVQRIETLDRIKHAAKKGDTSIILDDPVIRLFEDDYVYFEKLGYNVKRAETKIFRSSGIPDYSLYYYGVISWD